jgi:peroxiredoxin
MVALVQRPAPTFKATAVVDGQFTDVSLSDYLGQWFVTMTCMRMVYVAANLFCPRVVLLFYPMYVS